MASIAISATYSPPSLSTMPPRLNLRLPSQVSSLIHHHQFPAPATQSSLIPAFQRLWAQPLAQASQTRDASLLSRLSDAPGAKHRAIRRGRGPASGKGKTSGRGHKGQKQHGKVPAGFQGGQTPIEVVKGKRGFENM